MSNLSCGTHVAEPSANKDCRKLLNQFCRFLPKLKLPISADAKLPLTDVFNAFGAMLGEDFSDHDKDLVKILKGKTREEQIKILFDELANAAKTFTQD